MRKVFFIFLISLTLKVSGQNVNIVDSLKERLSEVKEPIARADLLNDICFNLHRNNPASAIKYAEEALELSQMSNYTKGIGDAHNLIGMIYFYGGNLEKAEYNFTKALEYRTLLNDNSKIMGPLLNLGNVYTGKLDFNKGFEYYRKAAHIASDLKNYNILVTIYNNIGLTYSKNQQSDSAIANYKKALIYADSTDSEAKKSFVHLTMGKYYLQTFNYNTAYDHVAIAASISKKLGDLLLYGEAIAIIGEINLSRGNYEEAVKNYIEASALYQKFKGKINGELLLNIGAVYAEMENYDEARRYYDKGLKIAETEGRPHQIGNFYGNIGNIYLKSRDFDQALQYYTKALDYLKMAPESEILGLHTGNLGLCFLEMDSVAQAEKYLNEALRIHIKFNNTRQMPFVYSPLARIYRDRQEYQKAREYYEKALEYAKMYNHDKLISGSLYSLSKLNYILGNYKEAYLFSIQSIVHKDSAMALERSKIVAEIATKYERDQNEREIILLQKEKQIKILELSRKNLELLKHKMLTASQEQQLDLLNKEKILKDIEVQQKESELNEHKLLAANKEQELALSKNAALLAETQLSRQRIIGFALSGGLILALMLSWLLYNRFSLKKKANVLLEQKNALIEMEKHKAEKAMERAVQSEKFKEQFLANMSHEIRTPMNAILGITGILLKNKPKDDQLKYLQAIDQSSNNLMVILNDILDLSKMEAGKLEIERRIFDIREEINNVFALLRFKAEEKGLHLKIEIEDEIPQYLTGDPARLCQVLYNLAGNAIKFTDKGFVIIKAELLQSNEEEVNVGFIVEDTGIGIEKTKLEQIFNSFTQVYSDNGNRYGGTGLGLTIAKQLVELQGGVMNVKSTLGAGTTFIFNIEYQISDQTLNNNLHEWQEELPEGLKILVAEDNLFNVMVIEDFLLSELKGAAIDVVTTGNEVIEKLKSNFYDLILMDVQMPDMNGLDATKQIRALAAPASDTPIIAMTANVLKSEIEKCLAAGMNDHISKPFDNIDMYRKIGFYTKNKKLNKA